MSSLFGSMSIALRSMMAQQAAISVTSNNVANINSEGYSRQRAGLAEADAFFNGSYMVGTGVELEQITSLRDRVLELRIQDEKQQQGSLEAQVKALQDIETIFSSDSNTIGDAINGFFNSISALSSDASNVPLRQAVLMAAGNLANSFRSASATLQQRQFSLDLDIQQSVEQVNQILSEVASLNGQIASNASQTNSMGAFEDRRMLLLQRLSSLIGNQVSVADDGLSVTTNGGIPLVVGDQATPLRVSRQADGSIRIYSQTTDVTGQIAGGELHGFLKVRQEVIPGLLSELDALAAGITNAVNAVHHGGTDLDGNPGAGFFVAPPAGNVGAAASMALNIADPRQIAASSDGLAGSNGNLNLLVGLREQGIIAGDRPSDAYAKIVFDLGSRLSNARTELNASDLVIEQLTEQRGAVSAVSLDEEAANLIRYQRAFEAAARVLSILSELTETSVNLGRS